MRFSIFIVCSFAIWVTNVATVAVYSSNGRGIFSNLVNSKPAEEVPGSETIGPEDVDDGCERPYPLPKDNDQRIATQYKRSGIVPKFISAPPKQLVEVDYEGLRDCQPLLGNYIDICGTARPPRLRWNCNRNKNYTIWIVDVHPLGAANPTLLSRGILWWVVDIPGCNVAAGKTLYEYQMPLPLYGSGQNLYAYGVFEQPPYQIDWSEEAYVSATSEKHRYYSCVSTILKYDLTLTAGNFAYSRFQPCVEEGIDKLDSPSPQYVSKSEERANLPADPYASSGRSNKRAFSKAETRRLQRIAQRTHNKN